MNMTLNHDIVKLKTSRVSIVQVIKYLKIEPPKKYHWQYLLALGNLCLQL
jgi:hypothetical protein